MRSLHKVALDQKRRFGVTHFVRIPLSTSVPRPQLDKAVKRISSDPVAASVPNEAFVPASQLHITIGELSLKSSERVSATIRYIHSLDLDTMLKEIIVEIERKNSDKTIQPCLPGLRVDVRGLNIHGSILSLDKRMNLWAPVTDTQGVVTPFRDAVRLGLARAGFLVANLGNRSAGTRLLEPYTKILSTKWLSTNEDNDNPMLVAAGVKKKITLKFDATELYPKYREFTWAKDVHLEKLNIY